MIEKDCYRHLQKGVKESGGKTAKTKTIASRYLALQYMYTVRFYNSTENYSLDSLVLQIDGNDKRDSDYNPYLKSTSLLKA